MTENIETPLPEPTPTKKHKVKHEDGEDADAKLAKKLQAEENANGRTARTTRNAGTKKTAKPKAAPKTKRNSTKKVDDDVDSSGEPVAKKRKANGAFNKPWNLSEPLAALVHEAQLSRPQTVKKIWEHIKAHNLQDPNDKRTIICDEVMLRVFGQKSVHMFTMNKLLSDHFYPLEPGQEAVVKDEAASNGMSEEVVKSEDEDEKVKSESDEE